MIEPIYLIHHILSNNIPAELEVINQLSIFKYRIFSQVMRHLKLSSLYEATSEKLIDMSELPELLLGSHK